MPGSAATLHLADAVLTHFEREESVADRRSKLEDDLVRVRDLLGAATSASVIVLNEIFSSTTLDDAVFLAGEVLRRVVALDALCVLVTFLDELVALSPTIVSAVSTVGAGRPRAPHLRDRAAARRRAQLRARDRREAQADLCGPERPPPLLKHRREPNAMQALLLHPDRDFDWDRPDPPGTGDLVRDLALTTLVDAMAKGDERLRDAARAVLLAGTPRSRHHPAPPGSAARRHRPPRG